MTDDRNPRGLYFLVDVANAVSANSADAELLRILREHGAPDQRVADTDASDIRSAAHHVIAILSMTEPGDAARAINTLLRRYPAYPRLVQLPGRPWSMHSEPQEDSDRAQWLLSTAALALGLWLSDRGRCAWGRCAGPECERFFIDTGRRQPQRFCCPRCATRSRVATHRQRATGRPSGS